jgi:hypothetical protein
VPPVPQPLGPVALPIVSLNPGLSQSIFVAKHPGASCQLESSTWHRFDIMEPMARKDSTRTKTRRSVDMPIPRFRKKCRWVRTAKRSARSGLHLGQHRDKYRICCIIRPHPKQGLARHRVKSIIPASPQCPELEVTGRGLPCRTLWRHRRKFPYSCTWSCGSHRIAPVLASRCKD